MTICCCMADTPAPLGTVPKVGVVLDGVPIFADAPSIQQSGHMPALDVCNGHAGIAATEGGGYHYHATETLPKLPRRSESASKTCAPCCHRPCNARVTAGVNPDLPATRPQPRTLSKPGS